MANIGARCRQQPEHLNDRFQDRANRQWAAWIGAISAVAASSSMKGIRIVFSSAPSWRIAFNALRLGPSGLFPFEQGKDRLHAKTTGIALVGIGLRA